MLFRWSESLRYRSHVSNTGMHREEERKIIAEMKEKIEKKKQKSQLNKDDFLLQKFNEFNDKYFQGKLKVNSIKFVTNQERVRGSCTPNKGTIRVSHKLLALLPFREMVRSSNLVRAFV